MREIREQTSRKQIVTLCGIVMFLLVLLAVIQSTQYFLARAGEERALNTQRAIQHAAILCYASEGFYPPSLSYIEEKYGVQIDYESCAVRYEVFATNVMPQVKVVEK